MVDYQLLHRKNVSLSRRNIALCYESGLMESNSGVRTLTKNLTNSRYCVCSVKMGPKDTRSVPHSHKFDCWAAWVGPKRGLLHARESFTPNSW